MENESTLCRQVGIVVSAAAIIVSAAAIIVSGDCIATTANGTVITSDPAIGTIHLTVVPRNIAI